MLQNIFKKLIVKSGHTSQFIHRGSGEYIPDCVRFEVFTAVTMKNGIFWDVNVSS
jgi:hypothetical protein